MQSATRKKEVLVANRVVSGQAWEPQALQALNSIESTDHLIPFCKELLLERQVFCDCLHDQVSRGKGIVGAVFLGFRS